MAWRVQRLRGGGAVSDGNGLGNRAPQSRLKEKRRLERFAEVSVLAMHKVKERRGTGSAKMRTTSLSMVLDDDSAQLHLSYRARAQGRIASSDPSFFLKSEPINAPGTPPIRGPIPIAKATNLGRIFPSP